jgi:hypothetical protein
MVKYEWSELSYKLRIDGNNGILIRLYVLM